MKAYKTSLLLLMFISGLAIGFGQGGGPPPRPEPPSTRDWTDIMVAKTQPSAAKGPARKAEVFSTPANFAAILQYSFKPLPLKTVSSLDPYSYYLIGSSSGTYVAFASGGKIEPNKTFETYNDTWTKLAELVPEEANAKEFRFDSALHSLYSLDLDSTTNQLVFKNNWGTAQSPSERGYVTFTYDKASTLLKVSGRQAYNTNDFTHASDKKFTFAGYFVSFEADKLILVQSAKEAKPASFYESPIVLTMPADFNPDKIAYQPNKRVPIKDFIRNRVEDVEGDRSKVLQDIDQKYLGQIAFAGDSPQTQKAAEAQLAEIKKSLEVEGARLRYPTELYLQFRRAALSVVLEADGIANGSLGMHAVPYVYFTNATDNKGRHHPFMVIASYSVADKPNHLVDVSRPPGDGSHGGYAEQNVTRDATIQLYLTKIPLRDYGLVGALTQNTMKASLKSDEHYKGPDSVYNYASTSGVAMAYDGVIIYPPLNNTLATAQESAEVTANGIHVGQGMGLHYHADGHTAGTLDYSLYNIGDYEGQVHPPVIAFGLDGIAVYGSYEDGFANMEGIGVKLDEFGGHSHGVYGYHYHAHQVAAKTANGKAYILHVLMKGAWKGLINDIPNFWDDRKDEPAYSLSQRSIWVGKRP